MLRTSSSSLSESHKNLVLTVNQCQLLQLRIALNAKQSWFDGHFMRLFWIGKSKSMQSAAI